MFLRYGVSLLCLVKISNILVSWCCVQPFFSYWAGYSKTLGGRTLADIRECRRVGDRQPSTSPATVIPSLVGLVRHNNVKGCPLYTMNLHSLLHPATVHVFLYLEQIQLQVGVSFISICLGLGFHENSVAFVPGAHWYFGEHTSRPPHSVVAQPYRCCDHCRWKYRWTQEYHCKAE